MEFILKDVCQIGNKKTVPDELIIKKFKKLVTVFTLDTSNDRECRVL